MNDLRIQKGIDQIKKVSLTRDERSKILRNLSVYVDFHVPVKSIYSVFSLWNVQLNKKFAYVLASIMIVILIGGSTVYASEYSLPGDLLYTIKIKITEPLKMALATTPKAKAELETKFAGKRLEEAETLSKKGRLTSEIKKELSDRFNLHVSNFYKIKKQIDDENNDTADENNKIQENFNTKIYSHTEILNKFDKNFEDTKAQENMRIKRLNNESTSSRDDLEETSK